MNLYSFSTLCFSFGVTLIAILILVKRRDRVAYRFLLFSISICGWGYLFSVWASQQFSYQTAILIARNSYFFVMFIPSTWLHFVFDFINKKEPFKYFFALNYALSIFFAFFCFSSHMIESMPAYLDFKYMPIGGNLHHFHVAHFFILVIYGLICLWDRYQKAEGASKSQLRYFVWGTLIGFISGGSIYITYYRIPLPLYHLIVLPLYPVFTGIALIRYGLFDPAQIADAFQREKMTALGVMAASLNHEIRNPLFIAKGRMESYLDAAERGTFENETQQQAKAQEAIAVASAQLTRAVDIMQRFSDFARPANSKKFKEKTNLPEMTRNVLELVSSEFQLQSIKVQQEIPENLELYIHKRQLEEILFNLVLNACHAMETKGGDLKIAASQNGKLKIEISDTGSGIAKEDQCFIFDPFYSTKGDKGTGLGLFITKRLVEQNNGRISVKSKLGQGTTFILEFLK